MVDTLALENFDSRVTSDFTAGTVGSTYAYTSTNGIRAEQNSNSNAPGYPSSYYSISRTLSTGDYIEVSMYFYLPSQADNSTYGCGGLVLADNSGSTKRLLYGQPMGQGGGNLAQTHILLLNGGTADIDVTQNNSSGLSYAQSTWYYATLRLTKGASNYTIDITTRRASDSVLIHTGSTTTTNASIGSATWWNFGFKDRHGSGSNGYYFDEVTVIVSWELGFNMKINISDSWKNIAAMKINIGDTWKDVTAVKINIGDAWKSI